MTRPPFGTTETSNTPDGRETTPGAEAGAAELQTAVKRYLGVTALAGVDLTIRSGELVALLGPNGAGKRVRCVTRLLPDEVAAWDGVTSARWDGPKLEVLASEAEPVVRWLLDRHPGLSDLEVAAASLEEAYLTLTAPRPEGAADDEALEGAA